MTTPLELAEFELAEQIMADEFTHDVLRAKQQWRSLAMHLLRKSILPVDPNDLAHAHELILEALIAEDRLVK